MLSNNLAEYNIDVAIGEIRLYLARDILTAFDGKEVFEPNSDRAPIIANCAKIRANDHVLTPEQKRFINRAIDKLQIGLNEIVDILRSASYDKNRSADREAQIVKSIQEVAERVNLDFEKASREYHQSNRRISSQIVNYGSVHMGDVFSNISDSSIVSRSHVEHAFNALQDSGNGDAANLIAQIAEIVATSNNHAAGAVFTQIAEQAGKSDPDKSILRSCLDGLTAILPSVASLAASVLKAFS